MRVAGQLSLTLVNFELVQILMRVVRVFATLGDIQSTLMQLLLLLDRDMRVEKTLMQTLASQLSLLLFSFDRGIGA
jgi:hypothetical protein